MRSDLSFHLSPKDEVLVARSIFMSGREALAFGVERDEFTIFGTHAQIEALVVEITRQHTAKLTQALRRALHMPEDSTDLEVLLKASLTDDAHFAPASTSGLSQSEATA